MVGRHAGGRPLERLDGLEGEALLLERGGQAGARGPAPGIEERLAVARQPMICAVRSQW